MNNDHSTHCFQETLPLCAQFLVKKLTLVNTSHWDAFIQVVRNKFPKHFLYSLKIFTLMQCFPKYILVIEKEPIVYVYNFYSSKIILYDTIKEQRHWQMLLKMSAMHRWLDGRWRWWKMVRMMKATQTSANWPCKHCIIKFKKFKNHY